MDEGVIEFVEPTESGKFVREAFDISDDDVKKLQAEAQHASQAIYDLSFWGKRCAKEECEFCELYVPLASR
jgi:hypothetical protein